MGVKTDEISRKYQNPNYMYLFLGQKEQFWRHFHKNKTKNQKKTKNKTKQNKNYTNSAIIGAICLN